MEAPPSHDHRAKGEIIGLPVKFLRDEQGRIIGTRSVWKPDAEQLALLNAGGGVEVDCLFTQPPLMLGACGPQMLKVPA